MQIHASPLTPEHHNAGKPITLTGTKLAATVSVQVTSPHSSDGAGCLTHSSRVAADTVASGRRYATGRTPRLESLGSGLDGNRSNTPVHALPHDVKG